MKLLRTLLIIFIVFITVPSFADEWVIDGDSVRFYDKSKIEYNKETGNLLISVYRVTLGPDIKRFQDDIINGKSTLNYSKYPNDIKLYEMNCRNKSITIISGTQYDNNGHIIGILENSKDQQNEIRNVVTPDSSDETFLKAVCRTVGVIISTKKKSPLQKPLSEERPLFDSGPITKSPGGLSGFDDLYRH